MKHFAMALTLLSAGAMAAQAQNVKQNAQLAQNQIIIIVDGGDGGGDGGGGDYQAPDGSTLTATAETENTTAFDTLVPGDNVGTTQFNGKWATVPINDSNMDIDGTDIANADGSPVTLGGAGTGIHIVSSQFQPGVTYYAWVRYADAAGNWNQGAGSVWTNDVGGQGGGSGNGAGSGNGSGGGGGGGGGGCSAGGSMSLCLAALASILLLSRK